MNRKICLSFVCLMALAATAMSATQELFRPASAKTVAAFRDLHQLFVTPDESGSTLAGDVEFRPLNRFVELDLAADDGIGARVLASVEISPEVASAVESLSRRGLADAAFRKSPEFRASLRGLMQELDGIHRRAKFDREGVRKSVAALIERGLPEFDRQAPIDEGLLRQILFQERTLQAMARFLRGDMVLVHHDFLRMVHRSDPRLTEAIHSSYQLRPAPREERSEARPSPPAPSLPTKSATREDSPSPENVALRLPSGEQVSLSLSRRGSLWPIANLIRLDAAGKAVSRSSLNEDSLAMDPSLRETALELREATRAERRKSPSDVFLRELEETLAHAIRESSHFSRVVLPIALIVFILGMLILFSIYAGGGMHWLETEMQNLMRAPSEFGL